jgi:hypothetical protein
MVVTHVLVILAALLFTDLLPVLGAGGAFSLFGTYVLPTIEMLRDRNWELQSWLSVRDVLMVLFGTFATVLSTTYAFISAVESLKA